VPGSQPLRRSGAFAGSPGPSASLPQGHPRRQRSLQAAPGALGLPPTGAPTLAAAPIRPPSSPPHLSISAPLPLLQAMGNCPYPSLPPPPPTHARCLPPAGHGQLPLPQPPTPTPHTRTLPPPCRPWATTPTPAPTSSTAPACCRPSRYAWHAATWLTLGSKVASSWAQWRARWACSTTSQEGWTASTSTRRALNACTGHVGQRDAAQRGTKGRRRA
jgi:hypothetical protein